MCASVGTNRSWEPASWVPTGPSLPTRPLDPRCEWHVFLRRGNRPAAPRDEYRLRIGKSDSDAESPVAPPPYWTYPLSGLVVALGTLPSSVVRVRRDDP